MFVGGLVVGCLLGAAAGAAIAWLAQSSRLAAERARADAREREAARGGQAEIIIAHGELTAANARLADARARIEQLEAEASARTAEVVAARAATAELQAAFASLQARADEERKAAQEKLAFLQHTLQSGEAKFRETFESLSADALRRNNASFLELARETLGSFQREAAGDLELRQQAIGQLVTPIRESLANVDEKIGVIEKERTTAYAALQEQVRALADTQTHLHAETSNLVKALRTPNVRGRWGEIQLKRVVELAGMMEHCDFLEQHTTETPEGRFRPDVIVRLPGGKTVVVDAKAPLDAYLSATECVDDAQRGELMARHARQVRDHIQKLSGKQYWGQFESSPEFVLMFLPGETFFSAALERDPSLIEYGVEHRVIVASPTTLIALLRSVAHGWRQEQIERNAQAISALGRTLYERLLTMAGHFDDVRKNLDRTVEAYNRTVGSLESRVLVQARRFGELGVTAQHELPELTALDRSARALQSPLVDDALVDDLIEAGVLDGTADRDEPPRFLTEAGTV
jgi:DNA recombination protein RmuC